MQPFLGKNRQNSTHDQFCTIIIKINYFLLHIFLQALSWLQDDREVEESSLRCGN